MFVLPVGNDGTTYSGLSSSCNVYSSELYSEGLDQFFSWTATSTILVWDVFTDGVDTGSNYSQPYYYDNGYSFPKIVIRNAVTQDIIDCTYGFYPEEITGKELSGWNIGDELMIQIANSNYINAVINFEYLVIQDTDINFCLKQTNIPKVANVYVNNITESSAQLGWDSYLTDSNWNIEYGESGFTQGLGNLVNIVNNSYSLVGLTESTSYDLYIQEVGSNGDSSVWRKKSFITLSAIVNGDYSYDFSSSTFAGWYNASEGDSNNISLGGNTGNWGSGSFINDANHVNGQSAKVIAALMKEDWLISPRFNLEDQPYLVSFETAINDSTTSMNSADEVKLLISTDNGISWVDLNTWNIANNPSTSGDNYIMDISSYNNTVRFAFWANRSADFNYNNYSFFIDNFELKSDVLSIDEYKNSLFSIYPNPTNNYINIDSKTAVLSASIFDFSGRLIKKLNFTNNNLSIKIETNFLVKGMYLLKLESEKGVYFKEIIKN